MIFKRKRLNTTLEHLHCLGCQLAFFSWTWCACTCNQTLLPSLEAVDKLTWHNWRETRVPFYFADSRILIIVTWLDESNHTVLIWNEHTLDLVLVEDAITVFVLAVKFPLKGRISITICRNCFSFHYYTFLYRPQSKENQSTYPRSHFPIVSDRYLSFLTLQLTYLADLLLCYWPMK